MLPPPWTPLLEWSPFSEPHPVIDQAKSSILFSFNLFFSQNLAFYVKIIIYSQEIREIEVERDHVSFTQFPSIVTFYISTVQYQDQEIAFHTFYVYRPMLSDHMGRYS
jgi:hypothetical protein